MRSRDWILAALCAAGVGNAQVTIRVPSLATPTIQSGINASANGDTVLVAPGIYIENIDFKGKAVTVTSSAGAATTIIDGGGTNATVTFQTLEDVTSVISGFTIRNGGPNASVTTSGGGVYINYSSPTVQNNVITANACNGVFIVHGFVQLLFNTVSSTTAPISSSCLEPGSGVGTYEAGAYAGPANGGDIYSEIEGNLIESNLQALSGGGLNLSGNFRVRNNTIRNNIAGDGSAIYTYEGNSGGLSWFSQNLIYGNDSNGSATYHSAIDIIEGPSISFSAFTQYFFNNTVAGNSLTATSVKSTEVYLDSGHPSLLFANNIIIGSTKNAAFECNAQKSRYDQMTFNHNDIYNPSGLTSAGTCNFPNSQYGNISSDPAFVSGSTANYHLNSTSPAVDAGETIDLQEANSYRGLILPATDLDGNARLQDATGKGYAVPDMGAYEFSGVADVYQTAMSLSPSDGPNGLGTFYEQDSNHPEPFTLTALLTSTLGIPTGSVNFYSDGAIFDTQPIAADGTAVTNSKTLVPGVHVMWASYAGHGAFSPTDAPAFLIAVDSYTPTLTLTSSVNPSLVGQSVTFTVQITSDINQLGPIYLVDGPTTLATLVPDSTGKATYTTSTLTLGSHQISAVYQGDATHNAVTATLTQQVVNYYPTSMTISSSVNPSTVGQPVTFSAQVSSGSGLPSGNITFSDGSTVIATVAVDPSGKATTTTSTLTLGNHTISAVFTQTGNFASSSASLTQQVIVGGSISTLSVMPTSGVYGTTVTMTATVSGNPPSSVVPTGTVTFFSNGNMLSTVTLTNGVATFSTATLPGGMDSITCTYSGDSNFTGSNCPGIPVSISSTTSSMTLTGTPNPAAPNTVITFTATLIANGAPLVGAQVTFTIDGNMIGTKTTSATGSVVLKSSGLALGQHTVETDFMGNSSASGSSATLVEVVVVPAFTLALQPATITLGPGQAGSTLIALTSVGGFNGPLTLSYGALPQYATATISPSSVTLSAGGTGSATLVLKTLLTAAADTPPRPGVRELPAVLAAGLALLLPLCGARRRRLRQSLCMLVAAVLLLTPLGCTNAYYAAKHVAPGTYPVPVTATDIHGNSQSATLTLMVTP